MRKLIGAHNAAADTHKNDESSSIHHRNTTKPLTRTTLVYIIPILGVNKHDNKPFIVMTDESLLCVASISKSTAKTLGIQNLDILELCLPTGHGGPPELLTTTLVQPVVVPSHKQSTIETLTENSEITIGIHPLLYEYLYTSYITLLDTENDDSNILQDERHIGDKDLFTAVEVVPLPIPGTQNVTFSANSKTLPWKVKPIQPGEVQRELPPNASLSLTCLYLDEELRQFCKASADFTSKLKDTLSFFLEGRLLKEGIVTYVVTLKGMALVVVSEINLMGSEVSSLKSTNDKDTTTIYRLGDPSSFHLQVLYDESVIEIDNQVFMDINHSWEAECPGYDKFVQELFQLVTMKGVAAPSGILLTGSPQVGKSHLASCVAHKLYKTGSATIHWVSVQDLLLQATWANESDLVKMLQPPFSSSQYTLLVMDDLHILGVEDTTQDAVQANVDAEMLVVRNSILQVVDDLSNYRQKVAILGIAQSSSNLPQELTRIGRLEKEVTMPPPTQRQREMILQHLISKISVTNELDTGTSHGPPKRATIWAEALSPVTVGCVAGDLCRLLAAAWTKSTARAWDGENDAFSTSISWEDLQEVTRTYVHLQLLDMDVSKPQTFFTEKYGDGGEAAISPDDWPKIHELSWQSFGGYTDIKKRLLRTVVGPWRRFLKSLDDDGDADNGIVSTMSLSPPPGVLFHGPSGNGKTFAASCLGSSLGLPMIKVRASDVMDKWLGGSEAIIRSMFARARAASPCILMFDEIDAVASNRANDDEGGSDVMARLLSTLLNEMDGVSSDKRRFSVLVVACTNRVEDLDAALVRPGRLEEQIQIGNPDESDIVEILKIHLARVPLAENANLQDFADDLVARDVSCADVEGICRECCFSALNRTKSANVALSLEDFYNALQTSRL